MPADQFQTLRYAAELVGGEEELIRRLGITPGQFARWTSGEERPPLAVFLKAVDIVHEAALGQLGLGRR